MPSSPLKRLSAGGGRLRRLLASLRPAARSCPLPVQTGFPTSLADLVLKNHGRFHNPRRRHRAPAAAARSSPAAPVPQPRREELSVTQDQEEDAAAAPSPAPAPLSHKGAAFISVRRPELLAVGGAVALALLLVWSKLLVAAATLASVALLWIESASTRSSRRRRPETRDELGLRCRTSPIREAEESPRPPSCAHLEPGRGSVAADDLGCDGCDGALELKEKRRRSLRRLLAKKLRSPSRDKDSRHRHGEQPVAGEVNAGPVRTTEPTAVAKEGTAPLPLVAVSGDDERWNCRRVGALPPAAVAPIVLVGLVAGKLPAVALTVLCLCAAVFSCSSISRSRASTSS
ncbi:hypothetical protein U9M48_037620 [Paspalum notatum var. saurae]|uniref:Uncharacterized protein n=1 Tax=Paspalum notatum var. saurae TaxID=547442 RepID=A0AAQ3XCL5_PASNO